MEEVNTHLYRSLRKGWVRQQPVIYYSGPPTSKRTNQETETRDDGQRRASPVVPQQLRVDQDGVSVPSEGIIQVEIARESIPGITFSRLSSSLDGYKLQIDYIHTDSSFSQSPLVPGLVVQEINNRKMIQQSPQDAQRELVNEYYPTTRIQVCGYVGRAHKPEKTTRLGLVIKDSSTAEGVYISSIKRDSIFWGAGLTAGLKVISINKRPCPKDILKAIKRLQRTTGMLEIVAVESHRESSQNILPHRSLRPIKEVCQNKEEEFALFLRDEVQQERMDESTHIISLVHLEEPPLPRDFKIKDRNTMIQKAENDSSDGSTASQSTFTRATKSSTDISVPAPKGQISLNWYRHASDPEETSPLMPCVDDPMLCSAFLDEVTEFVKEHTAMLDKAVRKLLGQERADVLLGEKDCTQWRVVDVRQYSQIESMPSIVIGSVDQPTPPMMLGIASARPNSPLYDTLLKKETSPVGVTVPHGISGTRRPHFSEHIMKEDPGLIVTGLEMNFTEKAVFVAKDSKRVRGGDNIVMAVLLFADNALLKMDKMCFS